MNNLLLKLATSGPYEDASNSGAGGTLVLPQREIRGYGTSATSTVVDLRHSFDAKENLRAIRSALIHPDVVSDADLRMAEQALSRQEHARENLDASLAAFAKDSSKIVD